VKGYIQYYKKMVGQTKISFQAPFSEHFHIQNLVEPYLSSSENACTQSGK
jgi:hypothetical protein